MIEGKRVLITGGGGFIGVSLAERLAPHNQVVLFDRDFSANAWAYAGLAGHPHIHLVEGDILDLPQVSRVAQGVHIVLHTAAVVGVQEVIHNPLRTLEVNYQGTANILKAMAHASACQRFVFFSTSEVYGPQAPQVREDADIFLPSARDARWAYCISKVAGEHLALAYCQQMGLPVVVVRPFNIFGPRRVGDYALLRFILHALRGDALEVYGDGTQIRAWCYIDDLCDGVLRCLEAPEAVGQVFNIGNPQNAVTIYQLAQKVVRLCASSSPILLRPLEFPDVVVRIPDIGKAQRLLGFTPRVGLEEGLVRTIAWVQEHLPRLGHALASRPSPSAGPGTLENG
ncbi:Bifunctional polymyxin resistance protein ArnA [bacterium HR23]|nr:Bifunctional polymyxin resistance protein ArnA [bacterium HR23]